MERQLDQYKYVEALNGNEEAHIRLDGSFGGSIDGAYVASEINYLDQVVGVKNIHLHINTGGGVVFDSLSIVGAILGAKATTHGHNEGMCMSAGFHTFLACDKLYSNDYAIFMYHSARPKKGATVDNAFLNAVNGGMITLIAGRLDKSEDEVKTMMKNETFFQATKFTEMLGLDIELKSSKRSPKITASMTLEEVVAEFESFNTNSKTEEMSEKTLDITGVMAALEIPADAKNPVDAVLAKVNSVLASNVALEEAKKVVEDKNKELVAELKTYTDKEAEAYIASLVEDKLVKEESKAAVLEAYLKNPEAVKAVYDAMPVQDIIDTIDEDKKSQEHKKEGSNNELKIETFKDADGNEVEMNYEWYQKNKRDELKIMMYEDEKKFNFLFNEYIAREDN